MNTTQIDDEDDLCIYARYCDEDDLDEDASEDAFDEDEDEDDDEEAARNLCKEDYASYSRAMEIAGSSDFDGPQRRQLFLLARRIQGHCDRTLPAAFYEPAVKRFTQDWDLTLDEVMMIFERAWDNVRQPEFAPLEEAFKLSHHTVIRLRNVTARGRVLFVASMAYHLAQIRGDYPFWLPRAELGRMLLPDKSEDRQQWFASDIVHQLRKFGVLQVVAKHTRDTAEQYRFGLQPEDYEVMQVSTLRSAA